MRDKVLCRGWGEPYTPQGKKVFSMQERVSVSLLSSLTILLSSSVPVSVREGEKMSIDEVLNFFDPNAAWKDQRIQGEFLERTSGQTLDTIFVAESLFRGTVLDFGSNSHSGGRYYANNSFTTS
jgi:hypothetical protein